MSSTLSDIFAFNIENNPILRKYKAMVERPNTRLGICVLSEEVLEHILHSHNDLRPFEVMIEAENGNVYSILQTLPELRRRRAYNASDKHEFSSIHLRSLAMVAERTIIFNHSGLPSINSDIKDVTMESAVFPFMFPFGHGQYDGAIRFADYIRMRSSTLFSVFTLYKPYLLLMYQLKQAILIANSTTTTVLQRDIDNYKRKNRNANDEDAIRNIL